jgi:hypothetical protein
LRDAGSAVLLRIPVKRNTVKMHWELMLALAECEGTVPNTQPRGLLRFYTGNVTKEQGNLPIRIIVIRNEHFYVISFTGYLTMLSGSRLQAADDIGNDSVG